MTEAEQEPVIREPSFAETVWDKLSAVDISEYVQKKGGFSYLSWSWAWGILMKYYPESDFEMKKEKIHPDQSVEVRCVVTVVDGDKTLKRSMWLPVMDFKNKAVPTPDSRDISDSRMRCLVKCISMFGLGHHIYAGEDVPGNKKDELVIMMEVVRKQFEAIGTIKEGLANDDFAMAVGAYYDIPDEDKEHLSRAATKGGIFTTEETRKIKSDDWSEAKNTHFGIEPTDTTEDKTA